MAKRKGRAARKQQREKAAKAQDHGLPAPELPPRPQRTRKVGGDTVAAAVASEKAGRAGPVRRAAPPAETGVPMGAKVLIGAAVALLIVFGLSQLRKSGSINDPARSESVSEKPESSMLDRSLALDAGPQGDETTQAPEQVEDGATSADASLDQPTDDSGEDRRAAPSPPPSVPASVPSSGVVSPVGRTPAPSTVAPEVSVSARETATPSSAAPKNVAPVAPAPVKPVPVAPASVKPEPVAPAPVTPTAPAPASPAPAPVSPAPPAK